MKWRWSLLLLVLPGPQALAQEPLPGAPGPTAPVLAPGELTASPPVLLTGDGPTETPGGPLTGNHSFRNFIGFMSNPLQSIDPRAVTAVYPLFGSAWLSSPAPVPDGDFQVYGPALTVALSDRLAVGVNQGGYAVAHFSRNERERLFRLDPLGRFRDVEVGGEREGWLNLGGFVQYTVIQDVADQFLLTGGLRWEAPAGSHEMFQGHGPLHLAPYLTAGKEFGASTCWRPLAISSRPGRAATTPTSSTPTCTWTGACSAGSIPWSSSTGPAT